LDDDATATASSAGRSFSLREGDAIGGVWRPNDVDSISIPFVPTATARRRVARDGDEPG